MTMELLRCVLGREKYLNLRLAELIESKCPELHVCEKEKALLVVSRP
jgi:hypothetical protein